MFQLLFGIERFILILNVIVYMLTNTYVQPYIFLLHFCVRNSMNTETICIETKRMVAHYQFSLKKSLFVSHIVLFSCTWQKRSILIS
jgi:hypothetical protein